MDNYMGMALKDFYPCKKGDIECKYKKKRSRCIESGEICLDIAAYKFAEFLVKGLNRDEKPWNFSEAKQSLARQLLTTETLFDSGEHKSIKELTRIDATEEAIVDKGTEIYDEVIKQGYLLKMGTPLKGTIMKNLPSLFVEALKEEVPCKKEKAEYKCKYFKKCRQVNANSEKVVCVPELAYELNAKLFRGVNYHTASQEMVEVIINLAENGTKVVFLDNKWKPHRVSKDVTIERVLEDTRSVGFEMWKYAKTRLFGKLEHMNK